MEAADYDGVWKEAFEGFLRPLLHRCFPRVSGFIDWKKDCMFLDQELQQIVRDADLGKQRVDKLVKVFRQDGPEEWLLVHLEMQSQVDRTLPLRMYQYQHRIADRFGRRVIGLAVLGDLNANWRPSVYEEETWGCRLRYEFLVCKLLDLETTPGGLEHDPDPAAIIIGAHLAAQRTSGNMSERQRLKWVLTRRLYEQGYGRQEVLDLFRLLDWLLVLPEAAVLILT